VNNILRAIGWVLGSGAKFWGRQAKIPADFIFFMGIRFAAFYNGFQSN
jgi:hypothetical protein